MVKSSATGTLKKQSNENAERHAKQTIRKKRLSKCVIEGTNI
jgi:hypothetical protein